MSLPASLRWNSWVRCLMATGATRDTALVAGH